MEITELSGIQGSNFQILIVVDIDSGVVVGKEGLLRGGYSTDSCRRSRHLPEWWHTSPETLQ